MGTRKLEEGNTQKVMQNMIPNSVEHAQSTPYFPWSPGVLALLFSKSASELVPGETGVNSYRAGGAAGNLEEASVKYINTVIQPTPQNQPTACKHVIWLLLQGLGSLFLALERSRVHPGQCYKGQRVQLYSLYNLDWTVIFSTTASSWVLDSDKDPSEVFFCSIPK